MSGAGALEQLLKRDHLLTLTALAVLCALAWLYLITGAGTGMSMRAMTSLSLFPHRASATVLRGSPWTVTFWMLMMAMWWVMMIAMMTPSAAPTILLYASVHRRAVTQGQTQGVAPTGAFVAGYLLVWLGFSIAAAVFHWALERAGLLSALTMGSRSRWLSAGVLLAAGVYQLTPVKRACLSHCRAPASFLARHWRPHEAGALRLGVIHGAYCVGCCWVLMVLLFVGGVMNLVWIAALCALVFLERRAPGGRWFQRISGFTLLLWSVATLVV